MIDLKREFPHSVWFNVNVTPLNFHLFLNTHDHLKNKNYLILLLR